MGARHSTTDFWALERPYLCKTSQDGACFPFYAINISEALIGLKSVRAALARRRASTPMLFVYAACDAAGAGE
jgi:hypothetical protein